jgi:hypothetical protein
MMSHPERSGLRMMLCRNRIANEELQMSKALHYLSILAAGGLTLAGSPQSSEARGISARSGTPHISSQGSCWAPNPATNPTGPTIVNTSCNFPALWHIPLVVDGNFSGWYNATVTAQGTNALSNVSCRLTSATKGGIITSVDGFYDLPFTGAPADINFSVWVPSQGTLMLDCFVTQGSMVHTVNW